jgi:hypothetical protein
LHDGRSHSGEGSYWSYGNYGISRSKKPMNMDTVIRPRTHGFRLSLVDVIVLVLAITLSLTFWKQSAGISSIGLLVVLHFFLFCNVFRIPRIPELIWGITFLVSCTTLLALDRFTPLLNAMAIMPVTVIILLWSIKRPSYHGIFAKQMNPKLGDYLAGKL